MLKTVGTELFVHWRGDTLKVGKITELSVNGDEVGVRETTCLGAEDKTYAAGVRDLGTVELTVDFEGQGAHKKLLEAYHSGEVLRAYIGLGDGTGQPLFLGDEVIAHERSGFVQEGFISTDGWTFESDEYVQLSVTIQRGAATEQSTSASMIYVLGTGVTGEVLGDGTAELFAGYDA